MMVTRRRAGTQMASGIQSYFVIVEETDQVYLVDERDLAGNTIATRVWAFDTLDLRSSPADTLRGRTARFIKALWTEHRCVPRGHSEADTLASLKMACHVLGRLYDMIPAFRAVMRFLAPTLHHGLS